MTTSFKGKIVIISFIYTSCTDICPLTTARMAQLEEKLATSSAATYSCFR